MAAAAILEQFQMAMSPEPVVRSSSWLVLGWVFRDGVLNGAISANDMYGQLTLPSDITSHHITVDAVQSRFAETLTLNP